MISAIAKNQFLERLYKYRFYLLFVTFLINFFMPTFSLSKTVKVIISIFTISVMILSAVNFIQKDHKILRNFMLIVGLFSIIFAILLNLLSGNIIIENIHYTLLFIFFSGVTFSLLKQIFFIKEVTLDVIVGSFCGYMLIGIISFFIFSMIEISSPDSLSGLKGDVDQRISQIFYFAFTCLTTIGFGDILPVNFLSQKLAVFTGALGQFYIAVVVAILVSRFMQSSNKKSKDQ